MSHKSSSLAAIDEVKEQEGIHAIEDGFIPKLQVYVNKRHGNLRNSLATNFAAENENVVKVTGRIVISF